MRYPTAESIKTGQDIELGRFAFSRSTALLLLKTAEGAFAIASGRIDDDGHLEIVRSWYAHPSKFQRMRAAFVEAFDAFEGR